MPQTGRGKKWTAAIDAHFAASHEAAESLDDLIDANPGRSPMAMYGRTRALHLPKNPRINWGRCWKSSTEFRRGKANAPKRHTQDERLDDSRRMAGRISSQDLEEIYAAERRLLVHK